jgi:hypothetical protein
MRATLCLGRVPASRAADLRDFDDAHHAGRRTSDRFEQRSNHLFARYEPPSRYAPARVAGMARKTA